jgi:hypothetical protein
MEGIVNMAKPRSERAKDRTQKIIEQGYGGHEGHEVEFNKDGVGKPPGKTVVLRTAYDRDIEALKFYYKDEDSPFPKYFWHDQIYRCLTCQKKKKEE